MLVLLNQEAILNESLNFARWQMAHILKVDYDKIEAKWQLDSARGKLLPTFNVPEECVEGVAPEDVQDVMAKVYGDVKNALSIWLDANKECRDGREDEIIEAKKEAWKKANPETSDQEPPVHAQEQSESEGQETHNDDYNPLD
jgi:hypothetical protein